MTEVISPTPEGRRAPAISFEFFPPKSEDMERSLWEAISRLAPLAPNFVSVTYGAGGSTRERTHSTITRILTETSLTPAAHLTCVDAPCGDVDEVVARYHQVGVRHIVALRGDPAGGLGTAYAAHPQGYRTSADLVAGIKKRYPDIEVSVSAYPEKHPESPGFDADIDTLKARSMPARRGPSRNSFSITIFTSAISTPFARAESRSRSCGAFCRSRISSRRRTSPAAPEPACRAGWRKSSKASTTIPTPASWWPPRSRPARCRSSPSMASTPFTSTP